jgi:hypothetical protein
MDLEVTKHVGIECFFQKYYCELYENYVHLLVKIVEL